MMQSESPPEDARISIDVDGDWYYNDLPIINETVLAFLQAHVTAAPGGGWMVQVDAETCPLVVADTPFVIADITIVPPADGDDECRLEARLNDKTREPFDIAGLHLRETGVPYSRVKQGRFPARLRRQAWNSLTPLIEHDAATDTYLVCTGSQRHPLVILPAADR